MKGRRYRIGRTTLYSLLQLFGSLLGIVQSIRLYRILFKGNGFSISMHSPPTDVAVLDGLQPTPPYQKNGFVPSLTTTTDSDRPEGSTRSPLAERTTLFPPYMFYTAANVTRAEIDSKEYRTHCRELNPRYELITYDDDMSRRFVVRHYPEWVSLYDSLDVPVMRADMWRYLVLHHYGGVYLDGDVDCKKPIDEWGEIFGVSVGAGRSSTYTGNWSKIGAMVGIEYRRPLREPQYAATFPPKLQFAQWTMAAQPGHYIYYRTIELINQTIWHIRSGGEPPGDAVYITGPVMFSHAVVDFMLQRGRLKAEQISVNPPNNHDILVNDPTLTIETDILVDNLALLHEDAFAYRGRNLGEANHEDHHTVYARHWYKGSWKPKDWKKMTEKQVHEASRKKVVGSGSAFGGGDIGAGALQVRVKGQG